MKKLAFTLALVLAVSLGLVVASNHNESEAPGTIANIAAGNPEFSTLVSALSAADLVEVLASDGPFTVFAPTNDAFAAIPEAELNALLADTEALSNVLLYHVVPGTVMSSDVLALEPGSEVTTVQVSPVTITFEDGMVMVNDATVTAVDITASNGVIHVIDTVIVPPSE